MPSLDLRFAETKSLTDWISGQNLITFSRASSGTVVNAAGALETVASNMPRLTHNPLTGESLGLLLEEQRTNLVTSSATFQPSSVGNPASYTVDQVAPDGTTTASRQTAANPRTFIDYQGIANAQYTFSVYAKAASDTATIALQLKNAASDTVIATGSYVTLTTAWRRLTVTGTTNGATAGARIEVIGPVVGAPAGTVFWGAQLEAGAFPTGYIPTTAATATRSADLADLISAAIANNIRAIYVEFRSPASGTRGVFSLNDNTANERSAILTSNTDSALLVHDNGIEQASIIGGSIAADTRVRVACRINQDSFAISVNGDIVRTDNTGTVPTVDRLMIGRTQAGDYLNASIARIVGWVEPLPDATLQAITR